MSGSIKVGGVTLATHSDATGLVSMDNNIVVPSDLNINNALANATFPAGHVVQFNYTQVLNQSADKTYTVSVSPDTTGINVQLQNTLQSGSTVVAGYIHSSGNGALSRSGDIRIRLQKKSESGSWANVSDNVIWPADSTFSSIFAVPVSNLNTTELWSFGIGVANFNGTTITIAKHYAQWIMFAMEIKG